MAVWITVAGTSFLASAPCPRASKPTQSMAASTSGAPRISSICSTTEGSYPPQGETPTAQAGLAEVRLHRAAGDDRGAHLDPAGGMRVLPLRVAADARAG